MDSLHFANSEVGLTNSIHALRPLTQMTQTPIEAALCTGSVLSPHSTLYTSQHIPAVHCVPDAFVGKTDGVARVGAQRLGGVGQPQGEGVFTSRQVGGQRQSNRKNMLARRPTPRVNIRFVAKDEILPCQNQIDGAFQQRGNKSCVLQFDLHLQFASRPDVGAERCLQEREPVSQPLADFSITALFFPTLNYAGTPAFVYRRSMQASHFLEGGFAIGAQRVRVAGLAADRRKTSHLGDVSFPFFGAKLAVLVVIRSPIIIRNRLAKLIDSYRRTRAPGSPPVAESRSSDDLRRCGAARRCRRAR